jgi:hypothetical protein
VGAAFKHEDFPKTDTLKLLKKPLKMEDGAVFLFERVQQSTRLSLEFVTWDNRLLRFGVQVSPRATLTEIFEAAQSRADEQLGNAFHYAVFSGDKIAAPPWKSGSYTLKLKIKIADSIVVNYSGMSMTVQVPLFQPDQWQRIANSLIALFNCTTSSSLSI